METIEFKGLSKLDEYDKDKVKETALKYYDKIETILKEIDSFKVHIKQHEKSGQTSRYTLIAQINSRKKQFEIQKTDYDLSILLNKTFSAIKNEIEKTFSSKG